MLVTYHYWQGDKPGQPFKAPSPNLEQINAWLKSRYTCLYWGIYSPWWNASGTSTLPSSHMFGAALDWRYVPKDGPEIIAWLVENSVVLGVQMVIDYKNRRIWKSDRQAWKANPTMEGGGDTRLHIETSKDAWFDATPVSERPGLTVPRPHVPLTEAQAKLFRLSKGSGGSNASISEQEAVAILQRKLTAAGFPAKDDGDFGPKTDLAVRGFQKKAKIVVDGRVGPQTWGKLIP